MARPGCSAARVLGAVEVRECDWPAHLDGWLSSFHPFRAVSLQETGRGLDGVVYLALFEGSGPC